MTRAIHRDDDSLHGDALQADLKAYLETIDRAIDDERAAQRLANRHARGSRVVGFRRRGHEVVLWAAGDRVLTIHEVRRNGELLRIGTIQLNRDLSRWLAEHHYYLEWVRPDLARAIDRVGSRRPATTRRWYSSH